MEELIKQHYNDEDIRRLNLHTDLSKWKSEVKFIESENTFYEKLFSSSLIHKIESKAGEIFLLKQELAELSQKNQQFLNDLRTYLIELEGVKECDDLHCETYYLNNHQKLKVEIESYLFENRRLKTRIHSFFEKGMNKFL